MRLSIILPVYNVEPYIRKALESIFDTTASVNDYEVIVVNDGTKDGSMAVVQQFTDHPNLIILEQENQGLSAARMKGLSVASGQFVFFVDSDDWLVEDGVGLVLRQLETWSSADVLMFPIIRCSLETDERTIEPVIEKERRMSGKDYIREGWIPSPCTRFVFKRKLLDNKKLLFPFGLLHEDLYWGPVLMYLADCIVMMTDPVYVYQSRPGSIMTSMSIRSSYDLVSIHRLLMDFMEQDVNPEDKAFFRKYCYRVLKWIYTLNAHRYKKRDFRHFVRVCGYYVWKEWNLAFPDVSWKKKIKRLAFSLMPGLYIDCFGVRAT